MDGDLMPTYVYSDGKHKREVTLTIAQVSAGYPIHCTHPRCNREMHRVPQVAAVNWNGLPPHLEHTRPLGARALVEGASERRARYVDTERNK